MLCETKIRENKIFLGTQCTQARARGYSRAKDIEFEQNTLFLLSSSQRSSEEGISHEHDPREFFRQDFRTAPTLIMHTVIVQRKQ